jgi:dynein heavy chain
MVTLLINMVNWVVNVEKAFASKKMEQAYKDQVKLLTDLILMVQGDLTKSMRQKIMCMITMDAHSRDIILKLHDEKVANADEF